MAPEDEPSVIPSTEGAGFGRFYWSSSSGRFRHSAMDSDKHGVSAIPQTTPRPPLTSWKPSKPPLTSWKPSSPPLTSWKHRGSAVDDGGAADATTAQDLTMPRTMVMRLAKGVLPPNTQIQKDAVTALSKGATVFINHLSAL